VDSLNEDLKDRALKGKIVIQGEQVKVSGEIDRINDFIREYLSEHASCDKQKDYTQRLNLLKCKFIFNGQEATISGLLKQRFPQLKIEITCPAQHVPFFEPAATQTVKLYGSKQDCVACFDEIDAILNSFETSKY
jgi:hypothetical protein